MKTKFLIVGGSGFLGTHLTSALIKEGYYVKALGRGLMPALSEDNLIHSGSYEWIQGNYSNIETLNYAMQDVEYVAHLASTTLPKTSNDDPARDVFENLLPSIQLIDIAAKNKVKKFIYYSSGGTVYGVPKKVPIQEADATDPICSYGIHKLAVEKYLQLYEGLAGLNFSVMRIANPYGPGQSGLKGQGIIGSYLNKIKKNEQIQIWGDGSVVRDYVHVGDVISATLNLIKYQGFKKIFNVGSGVGISINTLISMMQTHYSGQINKIYIESRGVDIKQNILDVELIKKETGWNPKYSLDKYLEDTLKDYK